MGLALAHVLSSLDDELRSELSIHGQLVDVTGHLDDHRVMLLMLTCFLESSVVNGVPLEELTLELCTV